MIIFLLLLILACFNVWLALLAGVLMLLWCISPIVMILALIIFTLIVKYHS